MPLGASRTGVEGVRASAYPLSRPLVNGNGGCGDMLVSFKIGAVA
jgi:hypothetical protein